MNPKLTPGKWFLNFDLKVVDGCDNVIANCDHPIQPDGHLECLANAKLLAASKDLRIAAEHALVALREASDCEIVRQMLKSAIKRADEGD